MLAVPLAFEDLQLRVTDGVASFDVVLEVGVIVEVVGVESLRHGFKNLSKFVFFQNRTYVFTR